jgi:hypothetical protein
VPPHSKLAGYRAVTRLIKGNKKRSQRRGCDCDRQNDSETGRSTGTHYPSTGTPVQGAIASKSDAPSPPITRVVRTRDIKKSVMVINSLIAVPTTAQSKLILELSKHACTMPRGALSPANKPKQSVSQVLDMSRGNGYNHASLRSCKAHPKRAERARFFRPRRPGLSSSSHRHGDCVSITSIP